MTCHRGPKQNRKICVVGGVSVDAGKGEKRGLEHVQRSVRTEGRAALA